MKEEAQDFDYQDQPEINDAKFNKYTPALHFFAFDLIPEIRTAKVRLSVACFNQYLIVLRTH